MNTALLGTLRLSIIDNLRAEIREREGVIADLTRDEEPIGALLSPTRPMLVSHSVGDIVRDAPAPLGAKRPTHGDAIAKLRGRGKVKHTVESMANEFLSVVKATGGLRSEEIAKAMGVKKLPMPAIRAALKGKLRMKGKRRGTTYFAK